MLPLGTVSSRCLWKRSTHDLLRRAFSSTPYRAKTKLPVRKDPHVPHDKWNYNVSPFLQTSDTKATEFKTVDANSLENVTQPPRGVKMLVRDFIEDSLYNPNYGYFPKQATIFNADNSTVDFASLRDTAEFQEEVGQKYAAYGADRHDGPGRQLWHTPTELFKPWYGRAIAQCLVAEYLLKYFPYEDFIVYEIGAGNGTLAMDILNYLQEQYPEVYERTRYNIIEISDSLVTLQKERLAKVHPGVQVVHKSIFHWKTREPAPCYFIAMEVIDNFAHDVVRYDLRSMEPYQGMVTIDSQGDFDTIYTPVTDPLISEFLELRRRLGHSLPVSRILQSSEALRKLYLSLPFAPNLSKEEYIPTRLVSLLRILRNHFPRHRLLLSDFSSLPDTVPGVNSPVVQTRFRNVTVPCSTLLVRQGYFDIFFPTNFERLRDMYEYMISHAPQPSNPDPDLSLPMRATPLMTTSTSMSLGEDFFSSRQLSNRRSPLDGVTSASGLPVGERKSSVFTHSEFMETYGDLNKTRLQNGENPMLDFYKNVKFLF
ncbi:S-adenosyl-L-methionine-dependent methyltransferase [Lyophyllum atratum]|nr:S-adenosyl-L-methionine-dependent methyltransferase [Lyophyllum atratum]